MKYMTQIEIIEEIEKTEELTAVEIIRSNEDANKCSVILNDKWFSMPYETDFDFALIVGIKQVISDEVILIMFVDNELPEAWRQSYLADGIAEENHDRRVEFHAYNDMNEMFCIDRTMLWDITDEFKGTAHELTEEKCAWRWNIIKWYKNHLI